LPNTVKQFNACLFVGEENPSVEQSHEGNTSAIFRERRMGSDVFPAYSGLTRNPSSQAVYVGIHQDLKS
jgi:hypothetical protein